jgi:hypothetical protein
VRTFGVLSLLGALVKTVLMVYGLVRHGRFPVRPETPTMNQFAVTAGNVMQIGMGIGLGVVLLVAAVLLKKR